MSLCDNHWKFWTFSKTLTLKHIFWKTQAIFKNLEYHFLIESTKMENATFPYKTATSEANVKINKVGSTKWTYDKGRSFASNSFIFSKILFHFKNIELIWCTKHPIVHVHTFGKSWSLVWGCFFLVSILK